MQKPDVPPAVFDLARVIAAAAARRLVSGEVPAPVRPPVDKGPLPSVTLAP